MSSDSRRARLIELLYVFVLIAVAALLRIDFLRAVNFTIDSDEAIVGLMGKHILEGKALPVFYYGQHYMGSLEAFMAALSFKLFGVSSFSLQLVPLLWSLALIPTIYLLGRECGGVLVGRIAALFAAIPPAALVVWSAKARGGFIEILVIGALALCVAMRWYKSQSHNARYPLGVGLLLGIGWWVNNQIIYFMLPIALFGSLHLFGAGSKKTGRLTAVVLGSAAFLLGSAPYWIYNLTRGFPSLGMFRPASYGDLSDHFIGLWSTAVPILLGAKHFWESDQIFQGSTVLFYLVWGLLFALALWVRRGTLLSLLRGSFDRERPVEVILVFLITAFLIFVLSSFGWLVQAPRYLLPCYVGLSVIAAFACASAWNRFRPVGSLLVLLVLSLNVASSYAGGRAVSGEPVVFNGERVQRDHAECIAVLRKLGIRKVRTNYWIGYRLAFETNEEMTFLVSGDPRQVRIAEYEHEVSDHERDHMPLLLVHSEGEFIRPVLKNLGYSFKEIRAGGYLLFYDLHTDSERLKQVELSSVLFIDAPGTISPRGALDGSLHTRWGSAHPQTPGQAFQVTFREPVPLRAIEYDLGDWVHDYPRGLDIELLLADGGREVLVQHESFAGIRYLMMEESAFTVSFPIKRVKGVRLVQTGSHPVFDWSISELRFFRDGE